VDTPEDLNIVAKEMAKDPLLALYA
jgi:hypothetical protein